MVAGRLLGRFGPGSALSRQRHRRAVRQVARPSCSTSHYFGEHIYGAQDDYQAFPRRWSSSGSWRDNGISGEQLLAFGDGYVEIENTKDVGGLAVAVASDEANNGSGRWIPGSGSGSGCRRGRGDSRLSRRRALLGII